MVDEDPRRVPNSDPAYIHDFSPHIGETPISYGLPRGKYTHGVDNDKEDVVHELSADRSSNEYLIESNHEYSEVQKSKENFKQHT